MEASGPRDEGVMGGGLDCLLGETLPIPYSSWEVGRNWSFSVLFCRSTACKLCNTSHGHVLLGTVAGTVALG